MSSNRRRFPRSAAGFSLIEVLVALLVLLIGLLGVVRMQLFSVQNNQGAYLRTQATYIASDMMDKMRANRSGRVFDTVVGGENTVIDQYEDFSLDVTSANPEADVPADPRCAAEENGCDAEQVADMDKREIASHFIDVYWLGDGNFVPTLPQGSIEVLKNPDGPGDGVNDEYVVTVSWLEQSWDEDDDGNAVRADSIRRAVQLRSMIRRTGLFAGVPDDPNDP